jgi:hypothetical protein
MANNGNLLHNVIYQVCLKNSVILFAVSLSAFPAYWLAKLSYCCGWALSTLGGAKDGFKNGKKKERFERNL